MRVSYNVYCDESCHLEKDDSKSMVLGAVWCPEEKKKEIFERIKDIKEKHGLNREFEIKWNKVSYSKVSFYKELVDFFFDDNDLHFRALIVPDKTILDHAKYEQTHDSFYYKMFFDLLKVILEPDCSYNIYIDIKDTKSVTKIHELQNILRNNHYDYSQHILRKIQQVRSHEVPILQLTDLLIGAIGYVQRSLTQNRGKMELIERIKKRSGYALSNSTLYKENKLNLFFWKHSTNK
jgi:hypothetical protein